MSFSSRLVKNLAIPALIVLASGCASHSGKKMHKDTRSPTHHGSSVDGKGVSRPQEGVGGLGPDIAIVISPNGQIIPKSFGHDVPFRECGEKCGLFLEDVKIESVKDLHITAITYRVPVDPTKALKNSGKANYHADGLCSMIKVSYGVPILFEDPLDPDCPNFIGQDLLDQAKGH